MQEETRNCGSQGRLKGEKRSRPKEKICRDVGRSSDQQKKKFREAAVKEDSVDRGEHCVNKAWTHVGQADCGWRHLEGG